MSKFKRWLKGVFGQSDESGVTAEHIQGRNVVAGTQVNIENAYMGGDAADDGGKALRRAYLEKLSRSLGILPLDGVDPKAAGDDSAGRLKLNAVYTALLTEGGLHGKSGAGMVQDREMKKEPALSVLNRNPYMVLLGDPGGGKTTFVNFVAMCLAGENLGDPDINLKLLTHPLPDDEGKDGGEPQPWDRGPLLPVRVILRDFASRGLTECSKASDLVNFVTSELSNEALGDYASHLFDELDQNGGLVLLDGLDEVSEAENRRTRIKAVVRDFMTRYPKCRILVTSRTYAYQQQEWRIPELEEAVLAPFSKGQIIRFIDRWYAHMAGLRGWNSDDARGKAELLKRVVLNTGRLRELAERPLLLTLMASLHAWRGGSLPEKRQELYADTVELLLDRWESEKIIRDAAGRIIHIEPSLAEFLKADKDSIRKLLDKMAYHAHEGQTELHGTADIPANDLIAELLNAGPGGAAVDPKKLLKFLNFRAGLLLPRGDKVFTFPHRTFQEYLAACHLTEHQDFPEVMAELARKDPGRWREVALLAGAKAASGAAYIIWNLADELCYKPVDAPNAGSEDAWGALLAGQALAETGALEKAGPKKQEKLNRIRDWQLTILTGHQLPAVERSLAGRNLSIMGDSRLEAISLDHMAFCFVPAGDFYMGMEDGLDYEKPVHLNTVLNDDYWMGRYPVTNAQFAEFVKAGGYEDPAYWAEAEKAGIWKDGKVKGYRDSQPRRGAFNFGAPFNFPNHPVVGVTWYEALAFTRWLTDVWREKGFLDQNRRIRLPSEAEWEKAARGGVEIPESEIISNALNGFKSPDVLWEENPIPKRINPWGNESDKERADGGETQLSYTNAVGCFHAGKSVYGCHEMAGWPGEWTRSLWGKSAQKPDFNYPYESIEEREDETAGNDVARIIRGFSYDLNNKSLRVCCGGRGRNTPLGRYFALGFRCVSSPIQNIHSEL